jgi:hypothetical protein
MRGYLFAPREFAARSRGQFSSCLLPSSINILFREQREKVRSRFSSQLHPYIRNKARFFSCDRILKQAIYVPGFSTSQNRVAPFISE